MVAKKLSFKKTIEEKDAEIEKLKKENLLLKEEIMKRNNEVDALLKISNTVVSGKYIDEILNLIVSLTAETMNSKICSIMLLNREKQELEIKATQCLSEVYRNKPNIKVGQSISGRAVKEKRPISVTDVTKEPGYMYPEIAKKEGICSMLCVPMIIKGKVIGVINSYTEKEHHFKDEEIKLLLSIASQAASAIENTRLMEETLSIREALETRKTVERAKGILMRELNITEDEAYRIINKKSMDLRKSMKDIAEAILLTNEMKMKNQI